MVVTALDMLELVKDVIENEHGRYLYDSRLNEYVFIDWELLKTHILYSELKKEYPKIYRRITWVDSYFPAH